MCDSPGSRVTRALSAAKCVRRTGHRLDREPSTLDGGNIAGEDHHVPIGVVDPHRPARSVGTLGDDARDARRRRARGRCSRCRASHGRSAAACGSRAPCRRPRPCRPGCRDRPSGVPFAPAPGARRRRPSSVPSVRYGCAPLPYGQAAAPMLVAVVRTVRPLVDSSYSISSSKREGIPGLCVEHVPEHDAVRLVLPRLPRAPADEAVNRVRMLRLRQRELMAATLELVGAVLDAVRPGDEHLAPTTRRHLVDLVAVDDVLAVDGVCPEPATHLDRDRPLIVERDLELLSGRRCHAHTGCAWTAVESGRRATANDHSPIPGRPRRRPRRRWTAPCRRPAAARFRRRQSRSRAGRRR